MSLNSPKFYTRLQLKYDSWSNWQKAADFIPLKGEVCIVEVPSTEIDGKIPQEAPSILIKVGNGVYDETNTLKGTKFSELPWLSAKAADVHAWAKQDSTAFGKWLSETTFSFKSGEENVTFKVASVAEVAAVSAALGELAGKVSTLETTVNVDHENRIDVLEQTLGLSDGGEDGSISERVLELEGYVGVPAKGEEAATGLHAAVAAAQAKADKGVDDAAIAAGAAATAHSRADNAYELAETKLTATEKAVGALDADKLGGQLPSYYATATALSGVSTTASAADTLSKTNKAAIEAINNTSSGILAQAKSHVAEELKSYSTTSEITQTLAGYVTTSAYDTKVVELSKAISDEEAARKSAITGLETAYKNADEAVLEAVAEELEAYYTAEEIDTTLEGYVTTSAYNTKVQAIEKSISDEVTARQSAVSEVSGKVSTLIGADADKSVRTIANEELAAQLLSGKADADFETLQELAAWLEDHPEDVAAINADILALVKEVYGTSADDASEFTGNSRIDLLEDSVSKMDAAYKLADTNLGTRIDNLTTSVGTQVSTAKTELTEAIATAKTEAITEAGKAADGKVAAEAALRDAADTALSQAITAAETAAKTHADQKATAAETAAKTHADQKATAAETAAKTYTNEEIAKIDRAYKAADLELSVAIATAESNAATDATTKAGNAETAAKSHADSKASEALSSAKTYTNEEIGKIEQAYKAADTATQSAAVDEAKTYTNTEVSKVSSALSQEITNRENAVKGVSDALAKEVKDREDAVKGVQDALDSEEARVDGIAARPFVAITENTPTNYVIFCCGSATECI